MNKAVVARDGRWQFGFEYKKIHETLKNAASTPASSYPWKTNIS
jgi:hypothetical protein